MLNMKLLATTAAIVLTGALGGCATPGAGDQPGPYAGRHNHLRDAKQGPGLSVSLVTGMPAPKLLHDHREWK